MAHWAELNKDNVVIRVVVADDDGHDWLVETLGGRWLQTSYNTHFGVHVLGGIPFRGNYAGVGYIYDETLDAFIPPKPELGEWVLDPATFQWVEPSV